MTTDLLGSMGVVGVSWLGITLVLLGIGLGVQRLFGLKKYDYFLTFVAFWVGFCVMLLILQIVHFFLPIRWYVSVALALLGVLGLAWTAGEWKRAFAAGLRRDGVAWLLILVAGVGVAGFAVGPAQHYDMGLYHLPMVRWVQAYPIIPGLANLHVRYGFNEASWLYYAALEAGPLAHRAQHVGASVLLMAMLAQVVWAGNRALRQGQEGALFGLSGVLLGQYGLWVCAAFSSDLPAGMLCCVALLALFRILQPMPGSEQEKGYLTAVLGLCAAAAICSKLSALIFMGVALLVAVASWVPYAAPHRALLRKVRFWLWGSMILLLGPWALRGYVLSGYPLFPLTVYGGPVAWRVPAAEVDELRVWIYSWARIPWVHYSQTRGWAWVPQWLERTYRDEFAALYLPLAIAAVALGLGVLRPRWHRLSRAAASPPASARLWLLLLPPLASIGPWFVLAPDSRFGAYQFWCLGAVSVALFCARWHAKWLRWIIAAGAPILAAVGVGHLQASGVRLWSGAGPDHGFHPLPAVAVKAFVTRSGLVLWVPTKGDQAWDAPLPNTPYPVDDLALRHSGDLGSGFIRLPSPPQP